MSAKGTFQFRNYTLREAGAIATDALLAKQWTEADPDHRDVDPRFWLEQDFDRDSYLLLDPLGPLFFWKGIIRMDHMITEHARIVEMHIQFPPVPVHPIEVMGLRARISQGLIEGLAWLEAVLRQANVEVIYFESQNPALIRFSEKHLGFVSTGHYLVKNISMPPGGKKPSGKETRSDVRIN